MASLIPEFGFKIPVQNLSLYLSFRFCVVSFYGNKTGGEKVNIVGAYRAVATNKEY